MNQWFMYQNRLGPSGCIYHPNFVPCFVYHQLNLATYPCRYLGHLEKEPSACVAMVGCPGVEKVEFTIFSENVVDSPAYVWNNEGSVKLIEMEVSFV